MGSGEVDCVVDSGAGSAKVQTWICTQLSCPPSGELGPVRPPDCLVCTSQYKLITELRGFMCVSPAQPPLHLYLCPHTAWLTPLPLLQMCSPAIVQSLRSLKRKKKSKHHRGSRDKIRTLKPSRDSHTNSRVSKTRPGPSAVSSHC